MNYRLSYCGYGEVNWCEALGTVLANDEVVNGVSERGGHPVIKKKLRQWYLRITDYADRLLEGLEKVDFSDAMKEMQSNWIGKSFGAEVTFEVHTAVAHGGVGDGGGVRPQLTVYTTRPDTLFGVDFMVVAPEHEILNSIVPDDQKAAVDEYLTYVKSRSERERMAERRSPAASPELMPSIPLMGCISLSGHPSTCWRVMAPARSWLFPVEMSGISSLLNISIFPSPIS